MSWYPVAVISDEPSEKVFGHVFKILNTEKTFKILDDYEGIDVPSENPDEYRCEFITVFIDNDKPMTTWVYLYKHSTEHLRLIPSGNYLSWGK